MRPLAALVFLLASTGASAQPRAPRCFAACQRVVTDARARATVCGACLTASDQPAPWLSQLSQEPPGVLADEDWEVRWGALLARARRERSTAPRQLARWLARAKGDELDRACLTAVHGAGGTRQALAELLSFEATGDRRARERCSSRERALREALWVELYAEDAATRREALDHLSRAFDRSPAREVLDALPSHPSAFDALMLDLLDDWAAGTPGTAPRALLAAAGGADVAAMNRLLAVASQRRDAARAALTATETDQRRVALSKLAALAPLSEAELLAALGDEVAPHRVRAARALARGEGRTVAAATAARLSGERPASEAQRRALIEATASAAEADCAPRLLEGWRSASLAWTLRRQALVGAASCSWSVVEPEVKAALAASHAERAAAVAALGFAPRTEALTEQLSFALGAREEAVRVAACDAIRQQRWRGGLGRVERLAADPSPAVRGAALRALAALDAPGLEARLVRALDGDPEAMVRAAAGELLSLCGGWQALSALEKAARGDPDPGVKLVAGQTLRKLRPEESPHP